MAVIVFGAQAAEVEQTAYIWKKYLAEATTTHYWQKYSRVSITTYIWNKYNRTSTTTHRWKKYSINYNYTTTTSSPIVGTGAVYDRCYTSFDPLTWTLSGKVTYDVAADGLSGGVGLYMYNNSASVSRYDSVKDETKYQFNATVYQKGDAIPGSYISTISSTNSSAYPDDGVSGSYYYVYDTSSTSYSQGSTSYGTVSSTSRSAYPDDGYSGSYWYVYSTSSTSYSQGSTSYGEVSSTSESAYPTNSYSGSYWYVYDRAEVSYSMGEYVEEISSTNGEEYPEDGLHDDGYWYVKEAA